MLIGARNWYAELGVTPVSVGTDAGAAYGLENLALPYRGAPVRSDKLGTAWGGAGIEVTWPRAVPVRLVGLFGEGNTARLFRWTLRNGGSGGALVAQMTHDNVGHDMQHASLSTNMLLDLGQRYTGDYLLIEWRILTGPLRFVRLWASDALALITTGLDLKLIDPSNAAEGITGAERDVEMPRYRSIAINAEIDNTTGTFFGAWDSDDEIDSGIEAAALIAGTDEAVLYYESPLTGAADPRTTILGRVQGRIVGSSEHGPRTPVVLDIVES